MKGEAHYTKKVHEALCLCSSVDISLKRVTAIVKKGEAYAYLSGYIVHEDKSRVWISHSSENKDENLLDLPEHRTRTRYDSCLRH